MLLAPKHRCPHFGAAEVNGLHRQFHYFEKRLAELDRLFMWLYEDNVSGKVSDQRFATMRAACLRPCGLYPTE